MVGVTEFRGRMLLSPMDSDIIGTSLCYTGTPKTNSRRSWGMYNFIYGVGYILISALIVNTAIKKTHARAVRLRNRAQNFQRIEPS